MSRIWTRLTGLVTVCLFAAGCLAKDVTHWWYLEPESAQVSWMTLESNVRSTSGAEADRVAEEAAYWAEVEAGAHPMIRALRQLGRD